MPLARLEGIVKMQLPVESAIAADLVQAPPFVMYDQSKYELVGAPTVARPIQSPAAAGDKATQLTVNVCPGDIEAVEVDADAA